MSKSSNSSSSEENFSSSEENSSSSSEENSSSSEENSSNTSEETSSDTSEEVSSSPPKLNPSYTLYPHQQGIVEFMREKEDLKNPPIKGGIINAVMGAGKTLSALYHIVSAEDNIPSLVVCPKSVLDVWKADITKFYDKKVKALILHPDYFDKLNSLTRNHLLKYDVVITTYEMCQRAFEESGYMFDLKDLKKRLPPNPNAKGKSVLFSIRWPRIFCDESHTAILNPATKTFKAMMCLSSDFVWCLSGTPVKNSSIDLLAQFWVCGYTRINSTAVWLKSYATAMAAEKLDNYILTITTKDTTISLPKKRTHTVSVSLSTLERKFYDILLNKMRSVYEDLGKGKNSYASVLALFTRLRQACIAPHLVTHFSERGSEKEDTEKDTDVSSLFSGDMKKYLSSRKLSGISSSKIQEAVRIILKIAKKGQKVVVFSKFVCALDLLRDALAVHNMKVDQIDGSVSGINRTRILDTFKNNDDHHVLLMSYGTGAVGLNIVEANHVLLLEPFWHDVMHDQAIARVWRNGQTEEVHVHKLIVKNSIEEKVLEICARKKKLTSDLLDEAATLKEVEKIKLTKEEMKKIIY